MRLGVLVAGHIEPPHIVTYGGCAHMFQRLLDQVDGTIEYEIFDVIDDQWPNHIFSCDAWLITGSACGVYENKPWMNTLLIK